MIDDASVGGVDGNAVHCGMENKRNAACCSLRAGIESGPADVFFKRDMLC